MDKLNHTSGPWMISSSPEMAIVITGSSARGNGLICTMEDYCVDPDRLGADARLIAAAPDMLEALTKISKRLTAGQDLGISDFTMTDKAMIDKAIGKAT